MAVFGDHECDCLDIHELIKESHQTAVEKGWWENDDRSFMECLMLVVSEIAEAGEEYRKFGTHPHKMIYYEQLDERIVSGKPEGIAVELADALIRIADLCGKHNIPLKEALRTKLAYNKTRPHRHGGKKA